MDKRQFKKLTKQYQLEVIRDEGVFLANRLFQGFIVSLFHVKGIYVELWKRIGLDYIEYVEVISDTSPLAEYLPNLDLKTTLDLQ